MSKYGVLLFADQIDSINISIHKYLDTLSEIAKAQTENIEKDKLLENKEEEIEQKEEEIVDCELDYEPIKKGINEINHEYEQAKIKKAKIETKINDEKETILLENFKKIIEKTDFQNIPEEIKFLKITNENIQKINNHFENIKNINTSLSDIKKDLDNLKNSEADLNSTKMEKQLNSFNRNYNNVKNKMNNEYEELKNTKENFYNSINRLNSTNHKEKRLKKIKIIQNIDKSLTSTQNSKKTLTSLQQNINTLIHTINLEIKKKQLFEQKEEIDNKFEQAGGIEKISSKELKLIKEKINKLKKEYNIEELKAIMDTLETIEKNIDKENAKRKKAKEDEEERIKKEEEEKKKKEEEEKKRKEKEEEKKRKEEEEKKRKEKEEEKKRREKKKKEERRKRKEEEEKKRKEEEKKKKEEEKALSKIKKAIEENNKKFESEINKIKSIIKYIDALKNTDETLQVTRKTLKSKTKQTKTKNIRTIDYLNNQIEKINLNVLNNARTLRDQFNDFFINKKPKYLKKKEEKNNDILKTNSKNLKSLDKCYEQISKRIEKLGSDITLKLNKIEEGIYNFNEKYKDKPEEFKQKNTTITTGINNILKAINDNIKEKINKLSEVNKYEINITNRKRNIIVRKSHDLNNLYNYKLLETKVDREEYVETFNEEECLLHKKYLERINSIKSERENDLEGKIDIEKNEINEFEDKINEGKKEIGNIDCKPNANDNNECKKYFEEYKKEYENFVKAQTAIEEENKQIENTVSLLNSKLNLITKLEEKLNKNDNKKIENKGNKESDKLKEFNTIKENISKSKNDNDSQEKKLNLLNELDKITEKIYSTKSIHEKQQLLNQINDVITNDVRKSIEDEIKSAKERFNTSYNFLDFLCNIHTTATNSYIATINEICNNWMKNEWIYENVNGQNCFYIKEAIISENFKNLFIFEKQIKDNGDLIEGIIEENNSMYKDAKEIDDKNMKKTYNLYRSIEKTLKDNKNRLKKIDKIDKKEIKRIFDDYLKLNILNLKKIFSKIINDENFNKAKELYCVNKKKYRELIEKVETKSEEKEIKGIVDEISEYNKAFKYIDSAFNTKTNKRITPYQYLEFNYNKIGKQLTYGYITERAPLALILLCFEDHDFVKENVGNITEIINEIQDLHTVLRTVQETNGKNAKKGIHYAMNTTYKKINEIFAQKLEYTRKEGVTNLHNKKKHILKQYKKLYKNINIAEKIAMKQNLDIKINEYGTKLSTKDKEIKSNLEKNIKEYEEIVKKLTNYDEDKKYIPEKIINGTNVKAKNTSNITYQKTEEGKITFKEHINNNTNNMKKYKETINANNEFLDNALKNIEDQVKVLNLIYDRYVDINKYLKNLNNFYNGRDKLYNSTPNDWDDFKKKLSKFCELFKINKSKIQEEVNQNILNFEEKCDNPNDKKFINNKLRSEYIKLLNRRLTCLNIYLWEIKNNGKDLTNKDVNINNFVNDDGTLKIGDNYRLTTVFKSLEVIEKEITTIKQCIMSLKYEVNDKNEIKNKNKFTEDPTRVEQMLQKISELIKNIGEHKENLQDFIKNLATTSYKNSIAHYNNSDKKVNQDDIEIEIIKNLINRMKAPMERSKLEQNLLTKLVNYTEDKINKDADRKNKFYDELIGNLCNLCTVKKTLYSCKEPGATSYINEKNNVKKYLDSYEILCKYGISINIIKRYFKNNLIEYSRTYSNFLILKDLIIDNNNTLNKNFDNIGKYIEDSNRNNHDANHINATLPLIYIHFKTSNIETPREIEYYLGIIEEYQNIIKNGKDTFNNRINEILNDENDKINKLAKRLNLEIPNNFDGILALTSDANSLIKYFAMFALDTICKLFNIKYVGNFPLPKFAEDRFKNA